MPRSDRHPDPARAGAKDTHELSDDELDAVAGGLGEILRPIRPTPTGPSFEDPLTAFEDPLTAFEDPLTARLKR